jgi:hypothetical protein
MDSENGMDDADMAGQKENTLQTMMRHHGIPDQDQRSNS